MDMQKESGYPESVLSWIILAEIFLAFEWFGDPHAKYIRFVGFFFLMETCRLVLSFLYSTGYLRVSVTKRRHLFYLFSKRFVTAKKEDWPKALEILHVLDGGSSLLHTRLSYRAEFCVTSPFRLFPLAVYLPVLTCD